MPGENQHDEESDGNEDKNVDDNHDGAVDGNDEDYDNGEERVFEASRLYGEISKEGSRKVFRQEKGTECRFIGDESEFRSRTKTVLEIHECGNWQTNSMII